MSAAVLLKKWDGMNHAKRIELLQQFYKQYASVSYREVEHKLGPSIDLFFTRITATLRLTFVAVIL
jgi:Family of unknown function (DUF5578)